MGMEGAERSGLGAFHQLGSVGVSAENEQNSHKQYFTLVSTVKAGCKPLSLLFDWTVRFKHQCVCVCVSKACPADAYYKL